MSAPEIPIAFGVIGCRHGHVFSLIKEMLQVPGAACAGVYEADDASAQAVLDRFPVTRVASPEALLDDPRVRVIATAEINREKAPLLVRALEAGKDVIADKPLCTTPADLVAIERIATTKGLRVGLMLTERFTGAARRMHALVAEGTVGQVANVMCWRPHRLGRATRPSWMFADELHGGIIVDLAVHDVDIIRWAAGGVFLEVTAYQQNWANPVDHDFRDIGTLLGRLSTGATGFVRTDWYTPRTSPVHGDTRFLVTGTEGMIEVRTAGDLWAGQGTPRPEVLVMANGGPPRRVDLLPPEKTLVRDFLESLHLGTTPAISNEDVFEATRATLMARQSCRLGRTVHRREMMGDGPAPSPGRAATR